MFFKWRSENKNKIKDKNVVFISDSNQFIYSIINAKIILNQTKANINIYLILANLSKKDRDFAIESTKNIYSLNLLFIDQVKITNFKSKLEHVTTATNIRLFLHEILDDKIKNVLYLDNDTVVMGDIDDLFSFVRKGKHYGRRWNQKNWWIRENIEKGLLSGDYINAGVIFLDLELLRKSNYSRIINKFYSEYGDYIKYADQDILNFTLNFNSLPMNFNIARDSWPKDHKNYDSNLKIYHFLSKFKQWEKEPNVEDFSKDGNLTLKEYNKLIEAKKYWNDFYKLKHQSKSNEK